MATTQAQQMALAIAPKFTAVSSIFGSSICIFLLLFRSPKRTTYHRLVLGMSLCDLSASTAWAFTTMPIPAGTPGVYGALGTQQTCSAQAFFAQFSLSTVMYNASLAIYYVLVIVKNKKDAYIVKVEPLLHVNAIIWGLGTGIAGLALTLFNQVGWDCWISASPLGCKESWQLEEGEVTDCVRGDNGSLYQWCFYYAPLWFVISLVSVLMYWVYATVRKQEMKMKKYRTSMKYASRGNNNTHQLEDNTREKQEKISQSKRVAVQALYYVGAFFLSWLFPTIFQLVIVITGKFPYPLLFLTAFSVPIQGLLNLIVFIRPKFTRYRNKNPNGFALMAWFRMLYFEITGKTPRAKHSASRNVNSSTFGKASSAEEVGQAIATHSAAASDAAVTRATASDGTFRPSFAKVTQSMANMFKSARKEGYSNAEELESKGDSDEFEDNENVTDMANEESNA